jgi:hypothetical protein
MGERSSMRTAVGSCRCGLDFAIEQALCTWWILSGWDAEDAEAVGDAVLRAAGSLHAGHE